MESRLAHLERDFVLLQGKVVTLRSEVARLRRQVLTEDPLGTKLCAWGSFPWTATLW